MLVQDQVCFDKLVIMLFREKNMALDERKNVLDFPKGRLCFLTLRLIVLVIDSCLIYFCLEQQKLA